jgi:hypothetical protein
MAVTRKRQRARDPEGQFKGNNPEVPEVQDAWKPIELPLKEKPVGKYSVQQKVNGTTAGQSTAGRYSNKKEGLVTGPNFNNVHTKSH